VSIQTGSGPIRIDPDDAQFTFRGKTLAIKIRAVSWASILGCIKQADGTWTAAADLTDDLFGSDVFGEDDVVAHWLNKHGGAVGFVRAVVLPHLNAWLAGLFPAGEVTLTPLEQVQFALGGIKFSPQADGTLTASI